MPQALAGLLHRGRTAIVAALVVVASVALGSAASLPVAAQSLGATTVTIPRCTTLGSAVFPELDASIVTGTTVGPLPPACAGATLRVTVDSGVSVGVGSITVPGGGGTVTVPILGGPVLQSSMQTVVLLEGP